MTTAIIETLELFEVTVPSLLIMIIRLDSAVSGFFIRYNVFHAEFRDTGQHGFAKKVTGSNGMHFTILDISAAPDIKFFHFIKKIEITHFSLCSKLGSLMEKQTP